MSSVDDVLRQYVLGVDFAKEGDRSITKDNYGRVIDYLKQEEVKSHGIIKNEKIIKFLQEWFTT